MLQVQNLSVTIQHKPIVQDVSFQASEGAWWMLLGPNGAGKTTLLQALACTQRYTGNVLLQGQNVASFSVRERAHRLGMLSQNSSVNAAFTVEQMVAMGRYSHRSGLFGAEEPDLPQRVEQALRMTGMTELREHSMLTLSGGERQRVFLSQVFCQDPQILLLDEPANHLDLVYQKQIFTLIDAWRRQPGKLVLSVVHDVNLARRFGTHALLMDAGRCVAADTIDQVLTDANMQQVWHMDVRSWHRELTAAW